MNTYKLNKSNMQINIYNINQIIWETKNKEKNILTYKIINSLTWKYANETL